MSNSPDGGALVVPTSKDEAATRFPVVGLGASAGGLAPITEILSQLGDANVAVVVLTHLDPSHKSSLVEILARATTMPVVAASDGAVVEPGHVYVLPPSSELRIERGRLHLAPRADGRPHTPVDTFFVSLAKDCGARAVGVVLSGTGADGALGIRAIKDEGGLTFAQDATATHDGMPKSAIATGTVDLVLAPKAIAEELGRIAAPPGPPPEDLPAPSPDEEQDLLRVLVAVRHATGIDFTHYKRPTLLRRASRRAFLRHVASLRDYAAFVETDAAEAIALSEEMLIHVTSFFRDPDVFEALKVSVFPRLVASRCNDAPIRIWVPGCSTGEETYSLAIALLEFLEESGPKGLSFKIFGTDLSAWAIGRARAALYPESIARDVSPTRLRRFFVRTERGYQILKDVRDRCVFAPQDLKRDPPFAKIDLISCRNVMIYLAPSLQQRVLPLFHYALGDPGFLLLGSAETVGGFAGFAAVDPKSKIYAREPMARVAPFEFGEARSWEPLPQLARPKAEKPVHADDFRREAERAIVADLAPAGLIVSSDLTVVDFRGDTGPYVQPAPGVPSFDVSRLVHEALRLPLGRALGDARQTRRSVRSEAILLEAAGGGEARVECRVKVVPFTVGAGGPLFFAVLFERRLPPDPPDARGTEPPRAGAGAGVEDDLRRELASTHDYLQSVVAQLESGNEELRAANEELLASNEELQSTNEELQTTSEELQATNEELHSLNDEMVDRSIQSSHLTEDLTNVLNSASIPIVLLGRDSRIRRFTQPAAKVLSLIPTDIGRPLSDIQPKLQVPELPAMIDDVLVRLAPVERVVRGDDGRWYQLVVRPYVTLDNRIDGTVVTATDIDEVKKGEERLARARDYAEAIVDTVSERLLVLDESLRVRSANRSFYQAFGASPRTTAGRLLAELGDGELDVPELRMRLGALGDGEHFADLRFERDIRELGRRVFVASGRRVPGAPLILLALDDITERAHAAEALERSEAGFRAVLASTAEAILISDAEGTITFANEAAVRMFGYAADELVGLPIDTLVPERQRGEHAPLRAGYVAAPSARPMGVARKLAARRKDGTEIPVEVMLSAMDGPEGTRVFAFVTDVTSRNAAARKILDYQAMLQSAAFDAAVAEQRERRRIAVDLHDHIGQKLSAAWTKMSAARDLSTGEPRASAEQALDLLNQSIEETRSLTFELSPPILYDLGLRSALAWLAEDMESRYGLHVDVGGDGAPTQTSEMTSALLFRATRELLMNVLKHANVGTARVTLRSEEGHVVIDVEDAGAGFDPAAPAQRDGFGLFSVREQIARLGGSLAIDSAPGRGARITVRVPLDAPAAPLLTGGGDA